MSNQQRAHDFAIAVIQSLLNREKLDDLKEDLDLIDDPAKNSLFNIYVHAYNSFLKRLNDQS